jgi:hypothetical protein
MKKLFIFLLFFSLTAFAGIASVRAAVATPTPEEAEEATESAEQITPLPTPVVAVKEKITEPKSEQVKGKLEALLEKQKLKHLSFDNFLKHAIRAAVARGVSPNTIVLIFLLPLVGAMVGILQYFVGLSGFGIFMPAMIAVTFLAIVGGLVLFGVILIATLLTGSLLRHCRLYYWPRRAITLMVISLIAFVLLFLAPSLGLLDLTQISIFPILFLVLLSEEFTRVQLGKSRRSAISLTAGTLVVSILGAALMNWSLLQQLVLLNPELSFLSVLLLNIFIGRYSGWRLLEYRRFKAVLRK